MSIQACDPVTEEAYLEELNELYDTVNTLQEKVAGLQEDLEEQTSELENIQGQYEEVWDLSVV